MKGITGFALSLFPALCLAAGPAPEQGPVPLTLKRAVEIALAPDGNTRIQLAQEFIRQARARSAQARAFLLPDLEGSFGKEVETRALGSQGLDLIQLPFNIKLPRIVGPFDVLDARATIVQSFDFSSVRRLQASHSGVKAAAADQENADDAVSVTVAKAYMAALRAEAELDAVNANVEMAQAVLKQSENQKQAGSGTGIEVTRAKVELLDEKQRVLVADNQRTRTHLELLRAMGLPLNTQIELTDKMKYTPMDGLTLEQARKAAEESRADLKAQLRREDSARLTASSVKFERLPTIAGFADYGSIGSGFDYAHPTYTYGYVVKVPVFDGFRRDARREESNSLLRQERIRTRDLKQQIELEVRLALDSIRSAEQQVAVAQEALGLAQSELEQARRRYEAGVATGLEVTDAQTRLAHARDNQIAALFGFNVARVDYGQATGTIRRLLE
ncbi:MAG TPA: TolC family protein [Bryobacteraceae bacterium]|nr:TolC family protein [Bryobacteraceae bacterium]